MLYVPCQLDAFSFYKTLILTIFLKCQKKLHILICFPRHYSLKIDAEVIFYCWVQTYI